MNPESKIQNSEGKVRPSEKALLGLCAILTSGFWLLASGFAASDPPPAAGNKEDGAAASKPSSSPFTNVLARSVFRELDPFTARDLFSPIGYQKPKPQPQGQKPPDEPIRLAVVEPEFKIKGILPGKPNFAWLEDKTGAVVQVKEGGSYTLRDKDGKDAGKFKVLKIGEDFVTISYNEKEYKFLQSAGVKIPVEVPESSDINKQFQEKE